MFRMKMIGSIEAVVYTDIESRKGSIGYKVRNDTNFLQYLQYICELRGAMMQH